MAIQTEDGNATALRPYEDDRILVNFSLWTSAEALHEFVYRTLHVEVMRHRREWFEQMDQAFTVLWWVPVGHRPTVQEAVERLEHLRREGRRPTPSHFSNVLRRPIRQPTRQTRFPTNALPPDPALAPVGFCLA